MTILWVRNKGRRGKGRKFNPPHWRPRRGRMACRPPPLSIEQVLIWADAYHARTGRWPKQHTGRIVGSLGENWTKVDAALRLGLRGLPGGASLAQLLSERRGKRNNKRLPHLTERQILAWADAYHERTGTWPKVLSGHIADSRGENWTMVENALRQGLRGLPGGSSLAELLSERRGLRNQGKLPHLTERQILAWADAYHERAGSWPKKHTGRIAGSLGETWATVDNALWQGLRGFQGGSSLAQLLSERRGVRNNSKLPRLTEQQILAWADEHHERTGKWPRAKSGPIKGASGESWQAVDIALHHGGRGLARTSSLARLLMERRGARNRNQLPPLTEKLVLRWADAHFKRTGRWPRDASGSIPEAQGETWAAVRGALQRGQRGLPGGSTLANLLMARRGVRNVQNQPPLTVKQILRWADEHFQRLGKWPVEHSGPVLTAPGETWNAIGPDLRQGLRGLPGGTSLHRLLAKRRGIKPRR